MSRAAADALLLVNWKGVFYERYLMDRHVTALEGANGAGKTTVMIAAFVVLLPDLSRLRFTNLGETGATGGDRGIWGRLGHEGPAYCAMEIALGDGGRAMIGVYLERKSEPSLSLKPFVVTNLPEGLREPILLDRGPEHEEVPQFDALPDRFKEVGATFETFSTAKDYFSALFELGIGPLRLSTDEERNKFSEMLRTSMTGGISRVLTSELRSFLFKEQSGLFDTLGRMRRNLDACRRTRLDVTESRGLEREINGIYAAGQSFFDCAHRGSVQALARAEHSHREVVEQSEALDGTLREQEALSQAVEVRRGSIEARLTLARKGAEEATERCGRFDKAQSVGKRLLEIEAEVKVSQQEVDRCQEAREATIAARKAGRERRAEAQVALRRASEGLANLESGLEQLHRRRHAHNRALDWKAAIESHLGDDAAKADQLGESMARVGRERLKIDQQIAVKDREQQTLAQRAVEQHQTIEALAAIVNEPLSALESEAGDLSERARLALANLNALDIEAVQVDSMSEQFLHRRNLEERRQSLVEQLEGLGLANLDSAESYLECLRDLELRWTEQEQAVRAAEIEEKAERLQVARLRESREALEKRRVRHSEASALVEQLTERGQSIPQSPEALTRRLEECYEERFRLRQQLSDAATRREKLLSEASGFENTASESPDPQLVALAERVEGQFLAERYESVEPHVARRVQAELGSLVGAIVVADPRAAARQARGLPREPDTLHFVALGAELPLASADRSAVEQVQQQEEERAEEEVIVDTPLGVRLTRLPAAASLGRRAREQRVKRLRDEAESLQAEQRKGEEAVAQLEAVRALLQALAPKWGELQLEEPAAETLRLEEELGNAKSRQTQQRERACEARVESARLATKVDALKSKLSETFLLNDNRGEADTKTLQELEERLEQARNGARELERVRDARAVLLRGLHSLSWSAESLTPDEQWEAQKGALSTSRDHWFGVEDALRCLNKERDALAWGDAERSLSEREQLVPTLSEQHEKAEKEVAAADGEVQTQDASWEEATAVLHTASAALASAQAHAQRVREELGALCVQDPSEAARLQAAAVAEQRAGEARALELEERGLDTELALSRERLAELTRRSEQVRSALRAAEQVLLPIRARTNAFLQAASALELHPSLAGDQEAGIEEGADAWPSALSHRQLMLDRLRTAAGGDALAEQLSDHEKGRQAEAEEDAARGYVQDWALVRAWLTQRLPAPVAELNDPLLGLTRLQHDLGTLEKRLVHQEGALKGTSSDVARSIEVQVRRAASQVRRLNQHLEGVSFGSIAAIRVKMGRVERMAQVLRALREGETQSLLFQSDLPIEEALNEIFKRYGGGRGGGQRLVDFREYLELSVEVQRRGGTDWQRVNPSQVSTGEAIGVGAALMMVILAEWEREGNLLRRKRTADSLRFLFLDEANRLSQDNLSVLFELCRHLDLQLLIAAPEVARSEGNTTYRLVRRMAEDGTEEVVVSGRRATVPLDPAFLDETVAKALGEDPPPAATAETPGEPQQEEMF